MRVFVCLLVALAACASSRPAPSAGPPVAAASSGAPAATQPSQQQASEPPGQPVSALKRFCSRDDLGTLERVVPPEFPFETECLVWLGSEHATPTCCSVTRVQSGNAEVRIVDVEVPAHDDCSRQINPQGWKECRKRQEPPASLQAAVPTAMLARLPRDFGGRVYVNTVESAALPGAGD